LVSHLSPAGSHWLINTIAAAQYWTVNALWHSQRPSVPVLSFQQSFYNPPSRPFCTPSPGAAPKPPRLLEFVLEVQGAPRPLQLSDPSRLERTRLGHGLP
jgi:hypothetical protein